MENGDSNTNIRDYIYYIQYSFNQYMLDTMDLYRTIQVCACF